MGERVVLPEGLVVDGEGPLAGQGAAQRQRRSDAEEMGPKWEGDELVTDDND